MRIWLRAGLSALAVGVSMLALLAWGQALTEIDFAVEEADFTVLSRDTGDGLGRPNTIALGDFNGDGLIDLLLGAPGGDGPDDRRTDAGEAYILFGRPDLPPTFDVDGVPGPDVIVYGRDRGDRLGSGVAAGDVNGDGIADVILGAPGADGPANIRDNVGEVVVLLGGFDLLGTIDLKRDAPAFTVYNNRQRSEFGTALLALDLNGDGIDDLVMADPAAQGRRGAVYVVYGSPDLDERRRVDVAKRAQIDVIVEGADRGDELGRSLARGDVNADGLMDLIVGAPGADGPGDARRDAGEAYVILGRFDLPHEIDLGTIAADVTVYGANPQDKLGTAVASGDVSGDGLDDLIVGAPGGSGPNDVRGSAGEVLVYVGRAEWPSVLDTRQEAGRPERLIFGARPLEQAGSAVAVADLDFDGLADVIIGAKGGRGPDGQRAGAGNVYVLRSTQELPDVVDLSVTVDLVVYGASAGDALGSSLAGADLTGLGEGILLMGAPGADSPGNGPDAGAVYALKAAPLIKPNTPPVADAGPDRTVSVGEVVQLDGTGSFDPDGDPLTFRWALVSRPEGSAAELDDPTSPTPSFTADLPGRYVLELTVDDGRGGTATATVTITAAVTGKGDVDGDGRVTILDARRVLEFLRGLLELDAIQQARGDVDDDGQLTLDDALAICEIVVGRRPAPTPAPTLTALGAQAAQAVQAQTLRAQALVGAHGVTFTLRGLGLEASRARARARVQVQALRVEVFDPSGRRVWASGWRPGARLQWRFAASPTSTSVPANGLYVYVVTVKREDGRLLRLAPQKLLLMR